mmetsp:Transcript_31214/g.96616  ORF Transcript_31214/g.96616 Transcript_31214/m.96616 type:complete len:354 (+) Transcript_31214:405-1466(+)
MRKATLPPRGPGATVAARPAVAPGPQPPDLQARGRRAARVSTQAEPALLARGQTALLSTAMVYLGGLRRAGGRGTVPDAAPGGRGEVEPPRRRGPRGAAAPRRRRRRPLRAGAGRRGRGLGRRRARLVGEPRDGGELFLASRARGAPAHRVAGRNLAPRRARGACRRIFRAASAARAVPGPMRSARRVLRAGAEAEQRPTAGLARPVRRLIRRLGRSRGRGRERLSQFLGGELARVRRRSRREARARRRQSERAARAGGAGSGGGSGGSPLRAPLRHRGLREASRVFELWAEGLVQSDRHGQFGRGRTDADVPRAPPRGVVRASAPRTALHRRGTGDLRLQAASLCIGRDVGY